MRQAGAGFGDPDQTGRTGAEVSRLTMGGVKWDSCLPETEAVRLLHRAYNRPDGTGPFGLATEDDWRRLVSRYWGLCSLVDTHVGTILVVLCHRHESGQDRDL